MRRRFILAPAAPHLAGPVESAPAPAPVRRRDFVGSLLGLLAGSTLLGPARRVFAAPAPPQINGAQPFLGEISIVGFNFAPQGWAFCNGQLMSIAQNTALFALLGTTYGGDGQSTFALPDLRSRLPIGQFQGPGLSNRTIGEQGGGESHTLISSEMPAHTHAAFVDPGLGTTDVPTGAYLAKNPAGFPAYGANHSAALGPNAIDLAGGNQPHTNMPPFLALNFIIALQGIFPSRS